MVTGKTYIKSPFVDKSENTSLYVVLVDYKYWETLEDELRDWCCKYLSKGQDSFRGSVLTFENEKEFILFELRWG